MFCTNCGAKVADGTKFCTSCGAELGQRAARPEDTASMPVVDSQPTTRVSGYAPASPVSSSAPAPREKAGAAGVVAVVMSLVALAAVVALVVVLDPFGLRGTEGSDEAVQTQQEQPAEQANEQDAEKNDDAAESDDADPSGGDNNVVVVVGQDGQDAEDGQDDQDADPQEDSSTYILPDSGSHRYTDGELSDLSDWELYLARNEIFARRGREFRNEDLQRYFESQSWYTPTYSPDDFDARASELLNDVERANAETILKLEQSRGSQYI